MKFLNLKNIKPLIYLNNIIGVIYVVLLVIIISIFINNIVQYNSYEKRINNQVYKLVKLKELNRKLLNNKFSNNFYSNEKSKITDELSFNIKKSLLNIKELKKNSLTEHLFLEKKMDLLFLDYQHLQKQYDLYFKYTLQLGNSDYGLYSKLLNSSDELFERLNNLDDNEIITHYSQMKNMLDFFQSSNNKFTYEFFKKQISQINFLLDKKSKNNSYTYLRIYDSFNEYKNVFNLFVKKKMQIGFNDEIGLTKKINKNFNIIESRLNETSVILYNKKLNNIIVFIIILVFISILFLIISYIFSRRFFIKQSFFINHTKMLIEDLDKGIFEISKKINIPVEFENVLIAVNKFSKKILKTEKVLLALPDRKINFEITDPDRIQFLDKSLLKIWKNFELSDNDLESEKEKRIVSDWIKTGLEKFTSILRKDFTQVDLLSKEILNNIIEHLNIAVGAIYLIKDKNESSGLDMVANFAFGKESHIKKEIDAGEGIIGTAAIEKKTLNITNIPANYYKVSSGFGSAMPKNLLIVPIKFENDFFGIIELASFRLIKAYELEFIEELGKAFAASLGANKVHQEVRKDFENLIEKSKVVENEKIRLENKIATLNINYNELEKSNLEYEIIKNNLDNSTIIFDINIEGYILSVNNQFYRTYKIQTENLNTTNYLDLLYKSKKIDDIDIDKFWNDIKLGLSSKIVHEINISDEYFWLSDRFIPIKDNEGYISKIKVISINITNYKKLEEIIEGANLNIQELKLGNENNDLFISKLKLELKSSKKEIEVIKRREAELIELIKELKNKLEK